MCERHTYDLRVLCAEFLKYRLLDIIDILIFSTLVGVSSAHSADVNFSRDSIHFGIWQMSTFRVHTTGFMVKQSKLEGGISMS